MTYPQQKLLNLFHLLALAKDEAQLRSRFMDVAGALFKAQSWGIALFNNRQGLANLDLQGLPETFVDHYGEIGWQADPLMRSVVEQHIPAHNLSVLPAALWQQTTVYQRLWQRYRLEHGLLAPLVGGGEIIGKIHFLRTKMAPAFTAHDLQTAGALSSHLSVCLATLRASSPPQPHEDSCLTQRELQITDLVARGLSNSQIAAKLGISQNGVKQALKRIFLKLNVSARAQMVAKLSQTVHS